MARLSISSAAMLVAAGFFVATPAAAIDGTVLITQSKAQAGNVTPGDAAGFPVSVTRAGSYTLGSNLTVPSGKSGILVTATEVSIDLNGFTINGAGGTAGRGIDGTQRSLTVRNGTIRGFKSHGVRARGALLTVDSMRIEENGGNGVLDEANGYARIVNSTIILNGENGIKCGTSCHIEDNMLSSNKIEWSLYLRQRHGSREHNIWKYGIRYISRS